MSVKCTIRLCYLYIYINFTDITLAVHPAAAATRVDPWSSSAEHVAQQFLKYIEELMGGTLSAGPTAPSIIRDLTSALSSRQSELSAKVINPVL